MLIARWVGAGRHVYDPFSTKQMLGKYQMYLWFGQYFNLTAMAVLKFSICAFMLQIGFSRWYRVGIWLTVVIHVALNVIFPYIILFGECEPIAKHWDPKLKGYCWSSKPRVISGYLGAGSNIITDLFYTFAPLIYIRSVQLPSRAMWGVRVVFLLGLITTAISVFKLYEVKALNESRDVSYESVNLSILSVTEVLVGSLTASLPPLRRLFENMLNRLMPNSIMVTRGRSNMNSYVLPGYNGSALNTRKSRHHESDDSSERTILADSGAAHTQLVQGKSGDIMRTIHVSLTVDETKPKSKSRNDWA
ncbi:hypothetical protein E8E11_004424 [Didymella keratinophila]|nr:hypothetical protein E8E11_004424 [Didymella keratinophila]